MQRAQLLKADADEVIAEDATGTSGDRRIQRPARWLRRSRAALGATTAGSPRLYIGCGVADALLPSSRRFASLLEGAHIPRRYEEGPGAHNWEAWDWQLRSFLEMVK